MPRRTLEPIGATQSSIAIASFVTMLVSAFAAVFTTVSLVKSVIHGGGATMEIQSQLIVAITPIVTLIASAVAFFSRILKKDQPPVVALTKAGAARRRDAAVARKSRARRAATQQTPTLP